nr:50S ribosomal protein L21 [Prochlorococcus marinus]
MTTKENKEETSSQTYAIVEASGKQFWLEPERYYDFDRINAKVDDIIIVDKVLLLNDEKGMSVGKPYLEGASVELKVMEHRRGSKIIVYKMRPKKKTRKKNGHRQELTRVMVKSISKQKKVAPKAKATTKETTSTKTASKSKETTTTKASSKIKKAKANE